MQPPPFILICTDKFRGSLEAMEVAMALKRGFLRGIPAAQVEVHALADGGEGTFELITAALGGQIYQTNVANALGEMVTAHYGYVLDSKTALIEMSQASGLAQLPLERRNPMLTHTYGTGQLILDALKRGARNIVLGIGGSATNDAGMGMACALGYRFFDRENQLLAPCGGNLIRVARIDYDQVINLQDITVQVACDVSGPLFGPSGAALTFSPQKGASPVMAQQLDEGLQHFSAIIKQQQNLDVAHVPGAGAAGGLGYGAMVFLPAALHSGIDLVMKLSGLENQMQKADWIITGEGKIDVQTLQGKVVAGVARLAQKYQKSVVAVCGTLNLRPDQIREMGLLYAESILTRPLPLETAQVEAAQLLEDWAERFCGVLKLDSASHS